MATYKIYQQLESGMAEHGLLYTKDVDDQTLGKSQAKLNELFNQGKNAQGEDIGGSSYTPGTGIDISKDVISGKEVISVKEASGTALGGIKIAEGQSANSGTPFPVQLQNSFGIVKIPEASTTQSGLAPQSLMEKIPSEASGLNQLADKNFVTILLGAKLNKAVVTTATEASTTAESAHAKGEYFFMGGTLYRATAAIAVGDTIETDSAEPDYNATATTIAGEIGNIATALEAIVS